MTLINVHACYVKEEKAYKKGGRKVIESYVVEWGGGGGGKYL